jgi:inner membrane protein
VVVAAFCSAFAARLGAAAPLVFGVVFLCTASHGVLDAMTTGGMGVAFFSPFSNHRYFFPWRVIEVAPISVRRFISERGIAVLMSELTRVWLPCAVLALFGAGVRRMSRAG